jgi:hypothetical protein
MTDIIIFKMKKYTYSSAQFKLDVTSISSLKTRLIQDKHFKNSDLVIFVYGGKILSDTVDISTIIHPICVYVLTDLIKNDKIQIDSMLPNLFTFLDSVNHPVLPVESISSTISIPLINPLTSSMPALLSPSMLLPPIVFPYQNQLDSMLDMGFVNENIIRNSLIMADGDIDEAINLYVNFG